MKKVYFILISCVFIIGFLIFAESNQLDVISGNKINLVEMQSKTEENAHREDELFKKNNFVIDEKNSTLIYEYENQQSAECQSLKINSPDLYREYDDFLNQYGLPREDLISTTAFNTLPKSTLLQLAKSGDSKAQYAAGIKDIWAATSGLDYFYDVAGVEENSENEASKLRFDNASTYEMIEKQLSAGENFLWESAVNGRYLALQELMIGNRFALNHYKKVNNHLKFKEELYQYLSYIGLANYIFEGSSSILPLDYTDAEYVLTKLREIHPKFMQEVEVPAFRHGEELPIVLKWKRARLAKGYLDTKLIIEPELAKFLEAIQNKCSGL